MPLVNGKSLGFSPVGVPQDLDEISAFGGSIGSKQESIFHPGSGFMFTGSQERQL
jgi:hypothetical protein